MIRLMAASLLLSSVAVSPAPAQQTDAARMPETLVIGYDQEGHVDATEASCRAFVSQVVAWDKAETNQAVHDVCAARQKHLDAYAAFQSAYAKLRAALQTQVRLDGGAAAKALASLVKSCIDMKWALSTGGHNVRIDMVPNEIAAGCLDMGREAALKEAAVFDGDSDPPSAKSGP